jgi:Mrp family chromosome partitioning ATPase
MAMAKTLRQLESRFDMVVIDGTPILPVTDSTVLAKQVGGAVLVVGSGDVTKDQLVHAIESLDVVNARLLGVVLNKAPKSSSGSYYDYRYQPEGLTRESRKLMRRSQQAAAR